MIYKIFWVFRAFVYKCFLGSIGKFCYLGAPKYIFGWKNIFIGERVRMFPGARLEVHGKGKLVLKDNISIGNDIHVACGGELIVSSGVLISSSVLLTDIDHEYGNVSLPVFDQPILIHETKIGENTFIGAGAKILAGTNIGKNCVVAANSVVRGKFPDFVVIAGAPAKVIKKFDFNNGKWIKV